MAAYHWTRENIVAAMQEWADRHGVHPRSVDWTKAAPDHPDKTTVTHHFGSWNKAVAAAGFTPRRAQAPGRYREWTRDEIADAFLDFLLREGRWPTTTDCGAWRTSKDQCRKDPRLPHWQTVRNHFGKFNDAKRYAGWDPDARYVPMSRECSGCGCDLDVFTIGCKKCGDRRRGRLRRQRPAQKAYETARWLRRKEVAAARRVATIEPGLTSQGSRRGGTFASTTDDGEAMEPAAKEAA